MEFGACGRENWRRAPGSVALACRECHGLITPCIICAHPIPFEGHSIWNDCGHCGAVNPMRELERHFLGFSPPLALMPSMVRRVLVAHVGWRQYTIALCSQYRQLQMAQEGIRTSDQNKDGSSHHTLEETNTVLAPNETACDLPFIDYDGILSLCVMSDEANMSEAKDSSPCEPLPKRMRIASENEGFACQNVGGHSVSRGSCLQMPGAFAEVSEGRCRTNFASSEADVSKNAPEQGSVMEDQMKEKYIGRKSNEFKVASVCSKCGSSKAQIGRDFLTSEGRFSRIETQLLALHSAESLSSDIHSFTCTYPICSSMHTSAIKATGAKTCVSQCKSICGARQQFSCFSIGILQLAHSVLDSEWKLWLVRSKLNIKEQLIEEVLSCAERFLENRAAIFHAQGLLQKAMAAQAQSKLDSRALLEHQIYISAGSLLRNILMEKVEERFNSCKKLIQPFAEILDQINMLLKFCFSQLGTHLKDPSVPCSLQLKSGRKFDVASGGTETVAEAVQAAVPLWLLLYHDVAHVTVLGRAKSATSD